MSKRGVKTEYVAGSKGNATSQERNTEGGKEDWAFFREWDEEVAVKVSCLHMPGVQR